MSWRLLLAASRSSFSAAESSFEFEPGELELDVAPVAEFEGWEGCWLLVVLWTMLRMSADDPAVWAAQDPQTAARSASVTAMDLGIVVGIFVRFGLRRGVRRRND